MNIVLIGYRCSGKTTVGRLVAGHLKMGFVDTDRLIEERTGMAVCRYVSRYGWESFRRVEREMVERAASGDSTVIGTGGGVVTEPENVRKLRRNGWVTWLKAGVSVIRERMEKAQDPGGLRPALSGIDPLEEIPRVLGERTPLYDQASDFAVDTAGLSPQGVADEIVTGFSRGHRIRWGGV